MHFRRFYNKALEEVVDEKGELMIESPFLAEKITAAQKKKTKGGMGALFKSMFTTACKDPDDEVQGLEIVQAGIFKGVLKVYNKEDFE